MATTVQTTLSLVDINCELIAIECDALMSPVRFFDQQPKNCALLVVIGEQCLKVGNSERQTLNEKVLLGLGAAHILFEKRVIVLADKRVSSLDSVQELNYYEFDGEHLNWDLGLELVRLLTQMKRTVECQLAVG